MSKGIVVTVGISNSGKSTWARQFVKDTHKNYVEVNRDELRIAMFCEGNRAEYVNYKFRKDKEDLVTSMQEVAIRSVIASGKGVVVSDTNLNPEHRNRFKELAKAMGVPYKEKVFDVPLEVCVARSKKRDISIPVSVLERQYKQFREYLGKPQWAPQPSLPKAVIFDVDGTLAEKSPDRGIFQFEKVGLDLPRKTVVDLLYMYKACDYKIVVCSGRDDSCYEETMQWLLKYVGPVHGLFMRHTGDKRIDSEVKEDLFWKYIYPEFDVQLCIDDRDQIVRQWRAMGLECFQVASGEF